jgi:hypothetical protein
VVAIDPATGGRRALWPHATISLEDDWTVAATNDATVGGSAATWMDAFGVADRSGAIPEGLVPTISSEDGRWAVFQTPAPTRAEGEIGPARSTSHFVVTDGAGWAQELTLDGNFAPEAFGYLEAHPMSLQMIEYLPADHPTRYRVRTLDLASGTVGLPVNLRDKATPVDDAMAGTSRTQAYAASSDLLFTLYQPTPAAGATSETWEYGFVHTLATPYAGVWCIDLPEVLGLEGHQGTLALSPDERTLFVATGAGQIGVIHTTALENLVVDRTADLGVTADEQPVMVAATDRIWVALGRRLLVVDPISLEVEARAELPSPVTALALDPTTQELVAADDGQLRRWTLDPKGQISEAVSSAIPLPSGLGAITRIALP